MKHHLSLLCFALTSFFLIDKAVANLLLKQNPTPLEPASYASSGESYQLAKVTWLPDYLGDNKSYGTNRVNDGGSTGGDRGCSTYGLLDGCAEHRIGKGVVHPIAGLTCYEECICDTSYYKYTTSNCSLPKELSEGCFDERKAAVMDGAVVKSDVVANLSGTRQPTSLGASTGISVNTMKYARCACPAEYNLSTCPTGLKCMECEGKYKQTGCDSAYNRTSVLANADCESCVYNGTTKYKCVCKSGYTLSGDACVANCSGYNLTVCPTGCNCEVCPQDGGKYKITSAKTAEGWSWSSGQTTCSAIPCPAGYTAGVTTCDNASTKPDYAQNGVSGGKVCGMCKCNNINANCTAANYPLTIVPANANYENCNTGCGSEKLTRYKITSCKDGYELKNGKCEAIPAKTCSSGGYNDVVPAGQVCTMIAYEGLTCYTDCISSTLCSGYYVDSSNVMYASRNEPVGIKSGSQYYELSERYPDQYEDHYTTRATPKSSCEGKKHIIPSLSMTTSLSNLEERLASGTLKSILSQKLWWTDSTSGTWINSDGVAAGGGPCHTVNGYWHYALADGGCYASDFGYRIGAAPLICLHDCTKERNEYCPSGYAEKGNCSNNSSSASTTLSDGRVCYQCFDNCPTGLSDTSNLTCSHGQVVNVFRPFWNSKECYACGDIIYNNNVTLSVSASGTCGGGNPLPYTYSASLYRKDDGSYVTGASVTISGSGTVIGNFGPVPVNVSLLLVTSSYGGGTCKASETVNGVFGLSISAIPEAGADVTITGTSPTSLRISLTLH